MFRRASRKYQDTRGARLHALRYVTGSVTILLIASMRSILAFWTHLTGITVASNRACPHFVPGSIWHYPSACFRRGFGFGRPFEKRGGA